MSTVHDLILQRVKPAHGIAEIVKKYLDVIADVVKGSDPAEYSAIAAAIGTATTVEIPEVSPDDYKEVAGVYVQLQALDAALALSIRFITNEYYSKRALYNMSATYALNIYSDRGRAVSTYDSYLYACADIDDKVFKQVRGTADVDDVYNWIVVEPSVNKFTIAMVGWLIQTVTGERKRRLELVVEKQKDAALGSGRIENRRPGITGVVSRYGLVPVTASLSPSAIAELFGVRAGTLEETIQSIAGDRGVIYMRTGTPSALEFDLRGLTDLEYVIANQLDTPPGTGLTKKVLVKYMTIKTLPACTEVAPIVIHPGKTPEWHVFETVSDGTARVLGTGEPTAPIAESQIIGLVHGLSTRAEKYNEIHAESILDKCYDPKAELLLSQYQDEIQSVKSSEPIKTAVVSKLTEWFTARLSTLPTSPGGARELAVDHDVIASTIVRVLANEKMNIEQTLTNLARYDTIVTMFTKEFERRWYEETLTDRTFKELSASALRNHLVRVFSDIAAAAAAEMDRTNMWTEYETTLKEFFLLHKIINI